MVASDFWRVKMFGGRWVSLKRGAREREERENEVEHQCEDNDASCD
jgi:hypothetical protein